uniref:Aspartate racemase n=1 Tax=Fagus sylvatica TaxID=28930 RepID=A0A2N9EH75_FAGSY
MHRNLYKTRLNPVLALPPSSILLHTDESGKFPEFKKGSGSSTSSRSSDSAGCVVSQGNTVGIIGGVSVGSTLNFLRKLVNWSSKDGESCVPFVLCSDPVLNKDLLSHERSYFPSLSCKSECTRLDPTPIVKNLQSKRDFLANSGARCIVMPCNVLHSWHDEVSKGCSVPLLHMGESVAKELKEAKLKPLEAGSPLRIGVLATDATLKAGFYQEKLQNEGFEVVLPDKATMEHTVIPAIEAINRKDIEGARNLLRIALQVLLVRAVNSVILASDDMRDLLPQDDPLLKKCIDPMDALVRSTIKWA